MKQKLKPFGLVLLFCVIYMAVLFPILMGWYGYLGKIPSISAWIFRNKLAQIILNDIIQLGLFYWIIKKFKKENLFQRCNFAPIGKTTIGLSLLMGLTAGMFTMFILSMEYITTNHPIFPQLLSFLLSSDDLYIFIGFLLVGSFYKEMLLRGLIFNELRTVINIPVAILIQGFLYSALMFTFNLDAVLWAYGALGAIIFGILYVWTRSMFTAVIMQITSTGTMYVIHNQNIYDLLKENSQIGSISCLAIFLVAFFLMKKQSDKRKSETNPTFEKYLKAA